MKVLICSSGRQESQANSQVRTSIVDGWAELVGRENVIVSNIAGISAAIMGFKPNIVLGVGSYLPETVYFGEAARESRRIGAIPVFWATEDPYEQDANYRIVHDFEVIFSCDRWGVNFYPHQRARHLPMAGCRTRHYVPYDASLARPVDVLFCGVAFTSRKEIVADLMPTLAGLNLHFVGPGWGQFGKGFSDRRVEKAELIKMYSTAKIVLNLGRSLHFENRRHMITPSTPGPRTFEVALAGALQFFHEDTAEMRRYFSKAQIPCFSTPTEFAALANLYLADTSAREKTLLSAQQRALSEHTYLHRAQQVIDTLRADNLL